MPRGNQRAAGFGGFFFGCGGFAGEPLQEMTSRCRRSGDRGGGGTSAAAPMRGGEIHGDIELAGNGGALRRHRRGPRHRARSLPELRHSPINVLVPRCCAAGTVRASSKTTPVGPLPWPRTNPLTLRAFRRRDWPAFHQNSDRRPRCVLRSSLCCCAHGTLLLQSS